MTNCKNLTHTKYNEQDAIFACNLEFEDHQGGHPNFCVKRPFRLKIPASAMVEEQVFKSIAGTRSF